MIILIKDIFQTTYTIIATAIWINFEINTEYLLPVPRFGITVEMPRILMPIINVPGIINNIPKTPSRETK
jgi:hypothetical protein